MLGWSTLVIGLTVALLAAWVRRAPMRSESIDGERVFMVSPRHRMTSRLVGLALAGLAALLVGFAQANAVVSSGLLVVLGLLALSAGILLNESREAGVRVSGGIIVQVSPWRLGRARMQLGDIVRAGVSEGARAFWLESREGKRLCVSLELGGVDELLEIIGRSCGESPQGSGAASAIRTIRAMRARRAYR